MIIYRKRQLEIPLGLTPVYTNDDTTIHNQSKMVDSSTQNQIITYDRGFTGLDYVRVNPYVLDTKTVDSSTVPQLVGSSVDGLSLVVVNPYVLDEKTVDPSINEVVVNSSADGLEQVTVNPVTSNIDDNITPENIRYGIDILGVEGTLKGGDLQEKTIDSSTVEQTITPDSDYYGLGEVTVNPYVLDTKTVDSSTRAQEITSNEDGLSKVTINPYVLDEKTVDSSTVEQIITSDEDGLSKVTVNPYELDIKAVDSSTVSQTVTSNKDGLAAVIVNPYTLDSKTVDPSTAQVVVNSSADGLEQVTVNPVTSNIDPNILPGNIREGVEILGVQGSMAGGTLEDKTVDSSTVSQTVTPDADVYGLSSVTVNPYVLDSKTVKSSNVQQVVTSSVDGLSSVTVDPYTTQEKTESNTFQNVNSDTQGSTVNVTPDSNIDALSKVTVRKTAIINSKTFDSSTARQSYNTQNSNTYAKGINEIVINPYVLDTKTVDSSTVSQTITSNVDGLAEVTVNPYTLQYKGKELEPTFRDTDTNGAVVRVEPDSSYDGLSAFQYRLPVVLNSKIFDSSTVQQVYDTSAENTYAKGIKEIVINPYVLDTKTVNPSTSQVVVNSSADGLSSVTVNAVTSSIDTNIQAGNIKQGVEILGVQGTFDGGTLQTKTVDSSTVDQTITPDSGNYGLSQVTVNKYTLDSKTVNSSTTMQVVNSSADGLSSVTILPYTLETKNVDASIAPVTVTPVSNGFSSVTVNAVTSSIDPNIVASNIREGVSILGVQGNVVPPTYDVSIYSSIYMASCYFETVYADMNDDCSVKFRGIPYTGSGWQFGVMADGKGTAITCSDVVVQYPWYVFRLDGGVFGTNNSDPSVYSTDIATYEFGIDNGICYIKRDGVTLCDSDRASGYEGSGLGWGIGGVNQGDGNFDAAPAPLYMEYCEFYRNGVLVNKYVPATDASGNIILFDTITKTYAEKQGSGTATLGSYTGEEDQSRLAFTVTPETYQQLIVASPTQPIGAVTVDPVTASIDDDIQPENIREGVSILGVDGTYSPSVEMVPAEYISNENDRSVYIDTGIAPTNNTIFEITMSTANTWWDSWGGWAGCIGGEYHLALFQFNGDRTIDGLYGPNGGSWLYGPGAGGANGDIWSYPHTYRIGGSSSSFADGSSGLATNSTFYYDYDSSIYGVGNVINSTWTEDQRMFVFGASNGEQGAAISQYAPTPMRVYRVRIIKNMQIVYDAVPYYNIQTSNYCLFDRISGKVSESSGTFSGKRVNQVQVTYPLYVQNSGNPTSSSTADSNNTTRGTLVYARNIGIRGTTNNDLEFRCQFELSHTDTNSHYQIICQYGYNPNNNNVMMQFGIEGNRLMLASSDYGTSAAQGLRYLFPGVHLIEVLSTNGDSDKLNIYVDGQFVHTFRPTSYNDNQTNRYMTWFGSYNTSQDYYNMYKGSKIFWIEGVGSDGRLFRYVPIRFQGTWSYYNVQGNNVISAKVADSTHSGRDYLR